MLAGRSGGAAGHDLRSPHIIHTHTTLHTHRSPIKSLSSLSEKTGGTALLCCPGKLVVVVISNTTLPPHSSQQPIENCVEFLPPRLLPQSLVVALPLLISTYTSFLSLLTQSIADPFPESSFRRRRSDFLERPSLCSAHTHTKFQV
jgi:hypothetical protein